MQQQTKTKPNCKKSSRYKRVGFENKITTTIATPFTTTANRDNTELRRFDLKGQDSLEKNHNYNTAITIGTLSRTLVFYNLRRYNKKMSDEVPSNNFSTSEITFVVGDMVKITNRDSPFLDKKLLKLKYIQTQLKVIFEEDENFVRFVDFAHAELIQQPPDTVSGNATRGNVYFSIKNLTEDDRDIMFLHLAEHVATMLIHTLGVDENLEEQLGTFVQAVRNSISEVTDD